VRLYFAYGANMVPDDMASRCPAARLLGPARLDHHRFAIIRSGHGTVLREPRSTVHGVLWRLAPGDLAALDRFEELASGLYRRERTIVVRDRKPLIALIYVAASMAPGRPRAAYIGAVIAAARQFGCPDDYVASLEAIARTSSGVRPDRRSARSVTDGSLLA
jgi:gamma-glutamylcyclotransferase (GGCT)/AIG2-like uncharacterized protein YtfP